MNLFSAVLTVADAGEWDPSPTQTEAALAALQSLIRPFSVLRTVQGVTMASDVETEKILEAAMKRLHLLNVLLVSLSNI